MRDGDFLLSGGVNFGGFEILAFDANVKACHGYEPSRHAHEKSEHNFLQINDRLAQKCGEMDVKRERFKLFRQGLAAHTGTGVLHDMTHSAHGSLRTCQADANVYDDDDYEAYDAEFISFQHAMNQMPFTVIKLDIEGGELDIFDHVYTWPDSVRLLMFEYSLIRLRKRHPDGEGFLKFCADMKRLNQAGFDVIFCKEQNIIDPNYWKKGHPAFVDPTVFLYRPVADATTAYECDMPKVLLKFNEQFWAYIWSPYQEGHAEAAGVKRRRLGRDKDFAAT